MLPIAWGAVMTSDAAIKTAYIHLAAYYGQNLSDRAIIMYAEDLSDLPVAAVLLAMRKLRREPGRRSCPLPSDVRRLVRPDNISDAAAANDIAARIGGALSRFGYTNPGPAEAHIGPVGWQVVKLMGGWRHLCNTITTEEMRAFYAQVRELARAQLEIGRVAKIARAVPPTLPEPARGGGPRALESVGAILEHSSFRRR